MLVLDIGDGLRCVHRCVEVGLALSDRSDLTGLKLVDLPAPLVVAAATVIGRNSTLQELIISLSEDEELGECNVIPAAALAALGSR